MRPYIMTLLLVISIGCNSDDMEKFDPIKKGETLSYSFVTSGSSGYNNSIIFYRTTEGKELEILKMRTGTQFQNAVQIDNNVYFNVENGNQDDGLQDLLVFMGTKGIINNLGIEVSGSFDVSVDQGYICYEYAFYKDIFMGYTLFIPQVRLFDLQNETIIEYDFKDSFLQEEWGVRTNIDYLLNEKAFFVEFFLDSPSNIATGRIGLADYKFTRIE